MKVGRKGLGKELVVVAIVRDRWGKVVENVCFIVEKFAVVSMCFIVEIVVVEKVCFIGEKVVRVCAVFLAKTPIKLIS